MARSRGGADSSNGKKKNGDGGRFQYEVNSQELDEEVHNAIQRELAMLKKQLTLEPILDNTEKQERLVHAILRMNISALRGTILHDSGPNVAKERKAAVDKLLIVTNAFEKTKHTPENINAEARAALNELSDTFKVFGPSWIKVRDSIVHLALEQIEEIKTSSTGAGGEAPHLGVERAELEKLEKRERERREKEWMERKEREKAEKEKKKKKKKNKKTTTTAAQNNDNYDDFGDDRVPPQQTMCEHNCTCHEESPMSESGLTYDMLQPREEESATTAALSELAPSRSRSISSSTFSCDDRPAISQIMATYIWGQFCHFYDQGCK